MSFLQQDRLNLPLKYRLVFINRKIFDDFSSIFEIIIYWCCGKETHQTFKEYLKTNKGFSDSDLKRKFPRSYLKLNQTSFTGFDITFLTSLLPLLCDGIAPVGSPEWKSNDENKIECQLNKIKELRNSVFHEPHGGAVDESLLDKVEVIADKLIKLAAAKYFVGTDEVNQAKDEVKNIFSHIKNSVVTKEELIYQFKTLMVQEGIPELRIKLESSRSSNSSFFRHVTGFYRLQLSVIDNQIPCFGQTPDPQNSFIFFQHILKFRAENPETQIIFIQGPSGSGKSTLLRKIQEDVLRDNDDGRIFEGSEEFDIPLFFKCRTLLQNMSLPRLVRDEFPIVGNKYWEEDLLECTINQMKVIFLVDGLDEINEKSKALVGEILAFLKNHAGSICIFTSRPHSINLFQAQLCGEGLPYLTLKIEEIKTKQEQAEFLRTSCENGDEVSYAYSQRNLNLQLPVHLGLYSFFYFLDPESVKLWRSPAHVMRHTIKYGLKDAVRRLFNANVRNCESIGATVLEKITFISFCCLVKRRFDLGVSEIKWLKTEIKELSGRLNFCAKEILSCFIPLDDCESIEYFHKSYQEILAAFYVYQMMLKTRQGIKEITTNSIKSYDSFYDLQINGIVKMRRSQSENGAASKLSLSCRAKNWFYARNRTKEMEEGLLARLRTSLKGRIFKISDFDLRVFFRSNEVFVAALFSEFREAGKISAYQKELHSFLKQCSGSLTGCDADWSAVSILAYNEFDSGVALVLAGALPQEKEWKIEHADAARAAAALLIHRHLCEELYIIFCSDTPRQALQILAAVVNASNYQGLLVIYLIHSHDNFIACDDVVKELKGAKCKLSVFHGCIEEVKAFEALSSISTRESTALGISYAKPCMDALRLLQNSFSKLALSVKYSEWQGETQAPLPPPRTNARCRRSSQILTRGSGYLVIEINNIPENGNYETIAKITASLCVLKVEKFVLELPFCRLLRDEVEELRQTLVESGFADFKLGQWSEKQHWDGKAVWRIVGSD